MEKRTIIISIGIFAILLLFACVVYFSGITGNATTTITSNSIETIKTSEEISIKKDLNTTNENNVTQNISR